MNNFNDNELRIIALAVDIAVNGFRNKGPFDVIPLKLLQTKLQNMLCACDARQVELVAKQKEQEARRQKAKTRREEIKARRDKILELRESGITFREIAKRFNVSGGRVYQLYQYALRDRRRSGEQQ